MIIRKWILAIAIVLCLMVVGVVDAATVKGVLYHPDGTLCKTPTVTVEVWDAESSTKLGTASSGSDGTYSVTYDAKAVSTTGDRRGTIFVRYIKNSRTTELQGASSGGSGTKIGGLMGLPAGGVQTIHAIVVGD